MLKRLRDFIDRRSLSFRLYVLIVPAVIGAILLVAYLDELDSSRMLDDQVRQDTARVATQLAEDLRLRNAPVTAQGLLVWLNELRESNYYITRIDVYKLTPYGIVQWQTTSSSSVQPMTVDEISAMAEGRARAVPLFQDRERSYKYIVPFSSSSVATGCVSVVSTLNQSALMQHVHEKTALYLIPVEVLVIILLLHYLFTRVLTGRIDRLVQVMTQARIGNLHKRAVVDRKDEVGTIAQHFNEMMDEIERASRERDRLLQEQKNFNAQLQQKVNEATVDLSAANERLRRVNEDLLETQRRLTQSERHAVVGQMAATFAHEIGSPLTAISTQLELMSEASGISDDAKRRVNLVQDQVNRITGFVEELLSETRAPNHARSAVQVNRLIEQLLLFLDQHLRKCKVEVQMRLSPDLPEIQANPHQLQQVLLNLLNNACDAMPGGGTVQVSTSPEVSAEGKAFAVVVVSDTGVGIPPEKQERIFEPFFTTKDLRRGTGLGLSIAARIVRQHGGTISLHSEPNRGATFTIRFPVVTQSGVPHREVFAGDTQL